MPTSTIQIEAEQGRPACFRSEKVWQSYLASEEEKVAAGHPPAASGYCTFCTPEYAAIMRAAGLCSHNVTWHSDEDGFLFARRVEVTIAQVIRIMPVTA